MAESEGQDTTPEARTVPYDRFQAVVSKRKELETQLASAQSELQALQERAATADTLAKQLEEMRATHQSAASAWERERAMMGAGLVDEQARVVASALYGTLPEADRPALADWLGTLKADPDQAPMALRPYLGAQQADPPAAAQPPRTTRQQASAPETGATASLEAIRAAKEHGRKTGDWTRFNELSKLARESGAR